MSNNATQHIRATQGGERAYKEGVLLCATLAIITKMAGDKVNAGNKILEYMNININ